jgi:hypothetical protein
MLVRLPRVPDLHDIRGLPVSEIDGPAGIVDQTAMEKLMSNDEALCGKHWTFSVSADAQTDRRKQSACSTSKWFCPVLALVPNEAGQFRASNKLSGSAKPVDRGRSRLDRKAPTLRRCSALDVPCLRGAKTEKSIGGWW